MYLNRNLPINGLIVFVGILVAGTLGCTKSSLRELALFRPDKEATVKEVVEASDEVAASLSTVWHDTYEAAQTASKQSGKPILAVFTGSDWCPPCKKLKANVFEQEQFKVWAGQNVNLLELDFPNEPTQSPEIKKQNAELSKKYGVQGYPTQLILSEQGEVLGKLGFQSDLEAWIASADKVLSK